jgi:hypothetical protein
MISGIHEVADTIQLTTLHLKIAKQNNSSDNKAYYTPSRMFKDA